MRMLRRLFVTMVPVLLAVAGCGASRHATSDGDRAATSADLDRAASAALGRWEPVLAARGTDQPFLLPTQATWVIGDLGTGAGSGPGFKEAWLSGRFETDVSLPTAVPPDAVLSWPGGGRSPVRLLSAAQAFQALKTPSAGLCPGCAEPPPLRVSAVAAGTVRLLSSVGPVEVPTWVFSLDGYQAKLARLAIPADAAVFDGKAPEGTAGDAPQAWTGSISPDGRTLTVTTDPAGWPQSCAPGFSLHAFESAHAVSLAVITTPPTAPPSTPPAAGVGCDGQAAQRSARVTLAAPLSTRIVLADGLPIAVSR